MRETRTPEEDRDQNGPATAGGHETNDLGVGLS